jgi:hypothetical protein
MAQNIDDKDLVKGPLKNKKLPYIEIAIANELQI